MLKKKRKEKLKAETTNTCKYVVLHACRPILDHWTRYETIKFDCKTQNEVTLLNVHLLKRLV